MTPSPSDPIVPIPPATTLSYDQSAMLTTNLTFKGRVKIACLKFADTIMNEEPSVTGHNVRMKWAGNCFNTPDMVAGTIQSPTVIDPAVQTEGSDIADDHLQAAVEGVINKMM